MNVFAPITRIRPLAWIAAALVVVLVVGLAVFFNMRKTINLSVDGEQREIVTYAASVGDVLEEEGIELAEHDVVAPDTGADLRSGLEIVVRYAHQLSIEVDGQEKDVWTTAASAEEALADMARRGSETSILASRSSTHGRLALDLPLEVGSDLLIDDAGEEDSIDITEDTTLGEVFEEQDIEIKPRDEVAIKTDTEVEADVIVEITRIVQETRTSTKKIKFESKTQNDSSIYKGESKLVTKGKNGEKELRHRVLLVNGEVVEEELLDEKVVSEPVHEVTAVGTKERPAPKPKPAAKSSGSKSGGSGGGSATKKASGSTDSLNWGALAQCESGGSATIVSANGLYHGLYQFSVPTWQSVGGSGLPSQAPAGEQTARAKMLYERSGAGQWPVCGKNLFR